MLDVNAVCFPSFDHCLHSTPSPITFHPDLLGIKIWPLPNYLAPSNTGNFKSIDNALFIYSSMNIVHIIDKLSKIILLMKMIKLLLEMMINSN